MMLHDHAIGRCPFCLTELDLHKPHVAVRNNFRVIATYCPSLVCASYIPPQEGNEVCWVYPCPHGGHPAVA